MAAALSPATTIVAVDRVGERLQLARELGATHTVDATTGDVTEAITELTSGGADGIVETTGSTAVLRAGVDALAHGVRDQDIDDEIVALFKQRPNLILTPNLPDRGVKTDLSWLKAGLPAAEFEKLEAANTDKPREQAFHGIQARNLAKLNAAGVRITLGTDGNKPWGPHEEMADMVLAGMTPMQVIVAATRNSAEFLRIADAGTLAAGKSADFIVLDANPLDDITNTRRISAVYLRGVPVDRAQPVN
jgi:imidazolonepropionase-like amidohydrolase